MREYEPILDNTGRALSRFDTVLEWLIIGLLAFMPLAFGVVHAWSEEVVIALSGVIVICFLLKLVLHRDCGLVWSWSYVPVGLCAVGKSCAPCPDCTYYGSDSFAMEAD